MLDIITHSTDRSTIQPEQNRPQTSSEGATAKAAMNPGSSTLNTTADILDNVSPSTSPSSSHLLTLPYEIRQRILQLALPYTDADWINDGAPLWYLGNTDVLRTCHQLHVEGTTALYSHNPLYMVIPIKRSLDKHFEPFLVFWGWTHCPNCGSQAKSWCCERSISDDWSLYKYTPMSPERLGMANIMLAREWRVEIIQDFDDGVWKDEDMDRVCRLHNAEKTQDLVSQVVERYLSQAKRLRKVWVTWSWGFRGLAAHPKCVEFRKAALKPLKDLEVPIEENFPYGAESETSAD